MKDQRSGSQILWGFLPEQTSDLRGGIFKTVEWSNPVPIDVEDIVIRRRLIQEMEGWVAGGGDQSMVRQLSDGVPIEVVSVNHGQGVRVERFPLVWVCSICRRVERGHPKRCAAGHTDLRQLHFVGYHECGRVVEPSIPRCQAHNQVRMPYQASMDASKIVFDCPICHIQLQKGLGNWPCPCGNAYSQRKGAKLLSYTVHRAASVYSPQSLIMVNPASKEKMRKLTADGGPRNALTWVLGGLSGGPANPDRVTATSFVSNLMAQGIPRELAEQMMAMAKTAGQLAEEEDLGALASAPETVIKVAEHSAVDVALATSESRIQVSELITNDVTAELRQQYKQGYPAAIQRAGMASVDLVDRFPVLKAVYGFTRGSFQPGETRLNRFHGKGNAYRIYADLQQAEALMFQLDPTQVHQWLTNRGHRLPPAANAREARTVMAAAVDIPTRFDEPAEQATPGEELLTLTHSMSHRAIRQLAVLAGVDREGLGEYLVPRFGIFFLFAATRGDFVLGGIQAVFENDLDLYLNALVSAESRCALDPACSRNGGSCHACMHLGEPVCGHFNRFLDRKVLFGPNGYLSAHLARA
jgi:hypothetical protein